MGGVCSRHRENKKKHHTLQSQQLKERSHQRGDFGVAGWIWNLKKQVVKLRAGLNRLKIDSEGEREHIFTSERFLGQLHN